MGCRLSDLVADLHLSLADPLLGEGDHLQADPLEEASANLQGKSCYVLLSRVKPVSENNL